MINPRTIISVFALTLGCGLFLPCLPASVASHLPVLNQAYTLDSASAIEQGDIVIQVNPADQDIDLIPGQEFRGSIKVKNLGRNSYNFNVSSRPYQVINDIYDPDFSTENSYTKLHNWLSFPRADYYLVPDEEVVVDFVVHVPVDAPGGGQYAAIIIETRDSINSNASFQTVNQVASLLHAHVAGETHEQGVLMKQTIPRLVFGSPFTVSSNIKNDGNIDFRANHSMTIWNFFTGEEVFSPDTIDENGRLVGSINPAILPASSRYNTLTWAHAPQLGVFRVKQVISFLDQVYEFEQIVFFCPLWLAGGLILFVVLMIIWLILRIRARRKRRPQVV